MKLFALTDTGKVRSTNQDAYSVEKISECISLCTVCDGMGGAKGGEEASSVAISVFSSAVADTLRKRCEDDGKLNATSQQIRRLFNASLERANKAVVKKSRSDEEFAGMGTTLVSALIMPERIYAINIGDSRMYAFSSKELVQITKDHSYVQYLVDEGMIKPEEAEEHPNKNVITRAIGISEDAEADHYEFSVADYEYILLCSDGLSNFVSPRDIFMTLNDKEKSVEEKVHILTDIANENGGGDNITVVLAQFGEK